MVVYQKGSGLIKRRPLDVVGYSFLLDAKAGGSKPGESTIFRSFFFFFFFFYPTQHPTVGIGCQVERKSQKQYQLAQPRSLKDGFIVPY